MKQKRYTEEDEERAPLALAERLVEVSSALFTARTEEAVRQVVLTGLAQVGCTARFFRHEEGRALVALDGQPLPADTALGLEALAEGRPVLGGPETVEPSHLYLPLVGPRPAELLWVAGPGLTSAQGSVLALFAKGVGAALVDARRLSDEERSQRDMAAVAEMARFVAQPEPPTIDQLLSCLLEVLQADTAALYLAPVPGQPCELVAHESVDAASRATLTSFQPEEVNSGDTGRGPVSFGEPDSHALRAASGGHFGCGALVRLVHNGQVHGVLLLLRTSSHPFQERELCLLSTLTELMSSLLERHRLRALSARQLAETRLLLDLARTTATTLETHAILGQAADFLVRLLEVSRCFILLHDARAEVLVGAAASGSQDDFLRALRLPLEGPSLPARVARERRTLAVEDAESAGVAFAPHLAQKALLALPLTSREELLGVVVLDDSRGPRAFGPEQVELAKATCGQLALAVANARLYESLRDSIKELKAANAELATTRGRLVKRERLAALGELSAVVAHEVRNPLGVIHNAVSALRRLLRPEGDAALLLDMLGEESDRLDHLVCNLLDFTSPREALLRPEEVRSVLEDVVETACAQQSIHPDRFHLEVEPGLPPVPMDRRLMHQALVNVAVNAVQAMPHRGEVRVRARQQSRAGRRELRIDVEDQGPGIPTELRPRLFEPFFTTKAQGSGLGLAVVKRILDEHHGEVMVDSSLGQGATFSLLLPLHSSESPT